LAACSRGDARASFNRRRAAVSVRLVMSRLRAGCRFGIFRSMRHSNLLCSKSTASFSNCGGE
jgi:hypothetical protein